MDVFISKEIKIKMEIQLVDLMKLLSIKFFSNGMFGVCNKAACWRFKRINKD